MILQLEKIREYKKKRDSFLNRIKENFDTFYDDKHDDLNSIIQFINYTDSFFSELVHDSSVEESAHNSLQVQKDSISRAVRIYNIDAEFNIEKANKWLINALILIVRDSNTFDGVLFTNGKKKLLKTKIVKQ